MLQTREVQVGEVHPGVAREGHTADAAAEVQCHGGGDWSLQLEGVESGCEEKWHAEADTAVLAGSQLYHIVDAHVLLNDDQGWEDVQGGQHSGWAAGHFCGDAQQRVRQACWCGYDVEPEGYRREVVGVAAVPDWLDAEAGVLAEVGKVRCRGGGDSHVDMDSRRIPYAPPGEGVGVELGHLVQAGDGLVEV